MMKLLLAVVVTTWLIAGCSNSPDQLVRNSEEAMEIIAKGGDPRLPGVRIDGMTDEEIDEQIATVAAEKERERVATQALWNAELSHWTELPCPARGSTDAALFTPQPNDGRALDLEPEPGWLGYEVVHVADIALSSGVLQESGGEHMGDGGPSVAIAEPGSYPFFMAMSDFGERSIPAIGQLVIDSTSPPVRWEDDPRFGFGTDGAVGWIGSPEAAENPGRDALFNLLALRGVGEDWICDSFQRDDGRNFVRYFNGWGDGFFPAAAGYDMDDDLVAITWFYGHAPWMLAGIPGIPPAEVLAQLADS